MTVCQKKKIQTIIKLGFTRTFPGSAITPGGCPIASRTPFVNVAPLSAVATEVEATVYLLAPGDSPVGGPVPKGTPIKATMNHVDGLLSRGYQA